ncbi:MAG: bifunctional glutamate N-acetyltransferase/amino-acid acetyltransferase ArgJ [Eggerthellaceae bacterium]|nr:bifunctional glutamate N-acetyltransferase/amino-acid acetyltransferase ArgJ [Eggerthellaceae bacterium]
MAETAQEQAAKAQAQNALQYAAHAAVQAAEVVPVEGGVCAPRGIRATSVHCGIRASRTKNDLSLIVSDVRGTAAAVYTTNLVKGAPNIVTKAHLADGHAQAVICNSGNANTCNADGIEIAEGMAKLVEEACGIPAADVIVGSTGVIGQPLSLAPIAAGMSVLVAGLAAEGADGAAGSALAVAGIMTTDTRPKEVGVEFACGGVTCRLGGICKGSGMIAPNMATMLGFLTTDAAISPEMLQRALSAVVADTFNMVSVDGDTSTNDMVTIMANGLAGNPEITQAGPDYDAFAAALLYVCQQLCRMIAGDGEGATKLLQCEVTGAKDVANACIVAKAVINSSLLKAAMFGADANWGRVLCAIGYSGADVDVAKVAVSFVSAAGQIDVCENGAGIPFSEEVAKVVLSEPEIRILITLGDGDAAATAYGCDLTYDYVKINGDYRT